MKYVCFILLLLACKPAVNDQVLVDFVLPELDLLPEGIAVDEGNQTIYLGSTYKRKIVSIDRAGGVTDFVKPSVQGFWSPVGMEVDEDRDWLWMATAHANEVMPLINPDTTEDWMTNISVVDLNSHRLIKTYRLREQPAFLNDLTLGPAGEVYITESVNNKVYRIRPNGDSLEVLLAPDDARFLNGLAFSTTLNQLYVAATEGVFLLDPATGNYQWLKVAEGINVQGIDGLTLYNNSLIGHQSDLVSRFYLDDTGVSVIRQDTLDASPELDASTTGEVAGNVYYYIVNSQIQSALNGQGGLLPRDSLEEVLIRRIYLKEQ